MWTATVLSAPIASSFQIFVNFGQLRNLPRVLHEKKQDVVLDGCQLDRLSVDGNFLVLIVDHQSAALVDLGAALLV